METRTRVDLPAHVTPPFDVFVNGVRQEPGHDYEVVGRALLFDRSLAREGRLGFWRWASIFLGIAGSYRRHDTIDLVHDVGGTRTVTSVEPTAVDE